MGSKVSKVVITENNGKDSVSEKENAITSNNIDEYLEKAKRNEEMLVKMLVLGTNNSDILSIFNQLRIMYGDDNTQQQQQQQQHSIIDKNHNTAVVTERFCMDGLDFEFYNVIGQKKSDIQKWINCFNDHIDAIIFVAALSDYDETITRRDITSTSNNDKEESDDNSKQIINETTTTTTTATTNKLCESLDLYHTICNTQSFNTILFLTKKDKFAEKIQHSDIVTQKEFSDYVGPAGDFNSGVLYFIKKFQNCLTGDNIVNDSFIHVTCDTDINSNIDFILDSTRTIIQKKLFKKHFQKRGNTTWVLK